MKCRTSYEDLKAIPLSTIREKINFLCYKKSFLPVLVAAVTDITCYLVPLIALFYVDSIFLKIIFGILTGLAASFMFAFAHDAAHGALFKNSKLAEIVGTLFMLPSLNVYRLWCYGHNRIHHGFTSFSPLDWIWRPLTVSEYQTLSWHGKLTYKLERSFLGCGLHYLLKVWWSKMVFFSPQEMKPKDKWRLYLSKLAPVIFSLILGGFAYFNSGIIGIFAAVVIPFLVFNYAISLVIYLHHTHPDIPFFDERSEWSHSTGVMFCSTVIRFHPVIEKLTHHISIHTPHHLDIRIPFYRLEQAYADLKTHYSQYIHEYYFNWKKVNTIFKTCKLYDYHKHQWLTFWDVKQLNVKQS